MKKKLTLQHVYTIFLCVHLALLVIAGFCVRDNIYYPTEKGSYTRISPDSQETAADGAQLYTFTVDPNRSDCYLMFYTNHQEVEVRADGELIYARQKSNTIFGHTTGAVWNLMNIPHGTAVVTATIRASYSSGADNEHVFYQGNGVDIIREMVHSSFLSVGICVLLILVGMLMIIYWLLFCLRTHVAKELLYMGILVLLMGAWAFTEERFVMILFGNRAFASYLTYVILMLMGVTFMLFLNQYNGAKSHRFVRALAWFGFGGMTLMSLLQALHIADFKQTVILVHALLVCDLFYLLFNVIRNRCQKRTKRSLMLNAAGLIVVAVSIGFELYAYYKKIDNMQVYGMLGLLVYIIILGLEISSDAFDKIEEIRKAEIYKELAEKDILTQCFNRNAYNDAIRKDFAINNTYLIMFDLNNLKKCNDTLGHMEGDRYLTDSAALIKKIFGDYGNVYRIGGDEFCIIMENTSEKEICALIDALREEEAAYNRHSGKIHMQIASGYAKYESSRDINLDQTRCRADELMYENKKQLKAAAGQSPTER